ncbi:MAG: GspE/PulE family protein [gamma proteobacterium symbiont of Bathyaustriella thionipta]|nr:GspE/PulE family protein [gamma proteobacterium symbiont of Bathyaustriella thionipta]MCU7948881.1 GspE/PulE family protein [gamma proteobacterium symbiont of Bathyaustriella thionipta]MCU7952383.1 GspE/PulE family protein [gamma proteobacterium symbiont of Bathyaustriella thionipta]MCU7955338.1 GspE/PulE family protein [gamma proteobacterium symbiont of Bathyaustriella thionipta]MCU7966114.1 GspE/PulE family protein [gamma proteobacterium symbiont of Bathyaustriella thionipta]
MQNNQLTQPDGKLDLYKVLDQLIIDGLVSKENTQVLRALDKHNQYSQQHPFSVITERGWKNRSHPERLITSDELTQWLSDITGIATKRIDPLVTDVHSVTSLMSFSYARNFNILPVEVTHDSVYVATAQPFQLSWLTEIERISGKKVQLVLANPEDIAHFLVEFYSVSKSVTQAEYQSDDEMMGVQNLEQLIEMGRTGSLDADNNHIVRIVDWLLQYAFEQRASDIHLEPRREQANVRFRIDGVMQQVYEIPAAVMNAVASRIKILGRMDVSEKRRPQDGRIKTKTPNGLEIELRLSTMPTAFGEKLVMRIFDPEVLQRGFESLGFGKQENKYWQDMIKQPNGIILVTGPTGSGKTSTLYTTLRQLAKPEVNVCTVEDPIEMIEPLFNQMQVQQKIDLDFAQGVRTLMRQDPDIIMIGEIRDKETAEMAIQASLTGHLVLSTLHTNDTLSALIRLQDIGVPPYLIHSSIIGIMAQRLVRTLCPHCKTDTQVDEDVWVDMVKPWKSDLPKKVYKPVGCLECRNTGYLGRIGLFEMLPLSQEFKHLLSLNADREQLRRQAVKDGYKPLRLSGAQKIAKGVTTVEEVLRVSPSPMM